MRSSTRSGKYKTAARQLLAIGALCLLIVGCTAQAVDQTKPTLQPTRTPTRMPDASPTTRQEPIQPETATPIPYPEVISRDNLEQLVPLYSFSSLGFYDLDHDWVVLYDSRQTAIWDLRSAKLLVSVEGRFKALHGEHILTASDDRLMVWQTGTGKQVLNVAAAQGEFHRAEPWLVVFDTPDGKAQLWDYLDGKLLGKFEEYPEDYFTFSPGGGMLAASGGEGLTVRVWELAGLDLLYQFEDDERPTGRNTWVSFTEEGGYLIVLGSDENKIFDLEAGELLWRDGESWAVYPGDDPRYAFITTDATTRIFDLEAGQYLSRYMLGDTPAFFPAVGLITNHDANSSSTLLYIYAEDGFEQLASVNLQQGITGSGSFFPAVNLFTTADQSGVIRFFDMTTWKQVYQLEVEDAASVYRPQFSRGGHWLLFGWSGIDAEGQVYHVFEVWGTAP